jgi:hypothetical protein
MSELQNVQPLLEEARRAADAGDLASAAALLEDAARIQEAELGPLHPEVANTLNNLGIVAESQGQIGEAETYYRRAVAITSAALPPGDPMVASSRKNLEDFCRERGLPIELPVAAPSVQRTEHTSDAVDNDLASPETKVPPPVPVPAHTTVPAQTSMPASDTRPVADSVSDADDGSRSPAAATTRGRLAIVAMSVVVLVAAMLLVMRPWSRGESPTGDARREAAAPRAIEPAPAPAPAAVEKPQPPALATRDDNSSVAAAKPATPRPSSGGLTLATSQLCRAFSTSGNWRCEPAGQSVAPGAIVLYTRVKSPRNSIVIHRWYRGNALRKSARLTILANPTDGYRTFSRQTVKSGENWRVEVTDTKGDVLYEQRVSVR